MSDKLGYPNSTPIMEFETEEQLQACIEAWKKVLFLQDWIIKGKLVDELYDDNGNELAGNNNFQVANNCSLIQIVRANEDIKSRIVKYCAEVTLVHELLHCKYNWTAKCSDSIEYAYYENMEHSLIEQMAKSLIMVKYNLPFEWFCNF